MFVDQHCDQYKRNSPDGLITTVLPAASNGANFQVNKSSGEFQGAIAAP
jgi:hypothetical protein